MQQLPDKALHTTVKGHSDGKAKQLELANMGSILARESELFKLGQSLCVK